MATQQPNTVQTWLLASSHQQTIFCCPSGPPHRHHTSGLGCLYNYNFTIISAFFVRISHSEMLYTSTTESISGAIASAPCILEVERSVNHGSFQCRYFVPSAVHWDRYVEVHARDVFVQNPRHARGAQAYVIYWCKAHRAPGGAFVEKRVTVLGNGKRGVGVGVPRAVTGMWLKGGPSGDWGS